MDVNAFHEGPRTWIPHKKQEQFVALPDSVFEGFYGGAASGGKTEVLYMLPLARQWYKHPRFKGIMLRRTLGEHDMEVIPRAKPWFEATGAVFNASKRVFTWPNGATFWFGHAEHERDIRKYDTAQFSYAAFDELTHFTEFQYRYIVGSRVRSPAVGELPAVVRSASNPGNVGHGWVRKRFVEPCIEGRKLLYDPRTKLYRVFIPARSDDNPHSDPQYLQSMELLPEAEKRAKKYGDWWTYEGQVFNFRLEPFDDEPENARHVINPFEIPLWWPRVVAVDWGYRASTWIGWAAISPEWRVYLYRELCVKETDIADYATAFKQLSEGEPIREVHIDPSAVQKRGSATIQQLFEKYSGYRTTLADNDRISGKLLMQDMLRWTPKPKLVQQEKEYDHDRAQYILRTLGNEAYFAYLRSFEPESEERPLPRLQVFDHCTNFIDCVPKCTYDEKDKEDVAEFDGDDPYDGGRYLLKAAYKFVRRAQMKGMKQSEIEKLQQNLIIAQQQNDQTKLYREAEALEAKMRSRRRPIRMHHSGRRAAVKRVRGKVH